MSQVNLYPKREKASVGFQETGRTLSHKARPEVGRKECCLRALHHMGILRNCKGAGLITWDCTFRGITSEPKSRSAHKLSWRVKETHQKSYHVMVLFQTLGHVPAAST